MATPLQIAHAQLAISRVEILFHGFSFCGLLVNRENWIPQISGYTVYCEAADGKGRMGIVNTYICVIECHNRATFVVCSVRYLISRSCHSVAFVVLALNSIIVFELKQVETLCHNYITISILNVCKCNLCINPVADLGFLQGGFQ